MSGAAWGRTSNQDKAERTHQGYLWKKGEHQASCPRKGSLTLWATVKRQHSEQVSLKTCSRSLLPLDNWQNEPENLNSHSDSKITLCSVHYICKLLCVIWAHWEDGYESKSDPNLFQTQACLSQSVLQGPLSGDGLPLPLNSVERE